MYDVSNLIGVSLAITKQVGDDMNTQLNRAVPAPASNTVAFSIRAYLTGAFGLVTRSGLEVVHLTVNSLCAVIENADGDHVLQNYESNGFVIGNKEASELDLIMYLKE